MATIASSFLSRLARARNKHTFTFNTFSNGLSEDPGKWKTHGFYAAGLDLIGIKDIAGVPIGGRPNVLQLSQNLKKDTISAGSQASEWHVQGITEWITRWDGVSAGNLYGLIPITSAANTGIILSCQGGTGTWVSAKATSAGIGGGGLAPLSAVLYYGQDAVLGQVTSSGVFNNNFATFTKGGATPRPMKTFAGLLNIGNDNYISTVSSIGTFTAAGLTLPTGFVVRSLEVLGNFLVISADNGTFARIFLWSGGSATYQEAYDLPELKAPLLVAKEGKVFAIGNQIYQLGEVNYQTLYSYSSFGRGTASL